MSRDMMGLFCSEVATVRAESGLTTPPRGVLIIKLLMEKSLVGAPEDAVVVVVGVGDASLTLIVSVWSCASLFTADEGLIVRGMVVSLTKVGGGAKGDVWLKFSPLFMSRDESEKSLHSSMAVELLNPSLVSV